MPPTTNAKPNNGSKQQQNSTTSVDSEKNQAVTTPASLDSNIDDVNKSVWQYIRKRKMWEFLLVVPFLLARESFIIYLFINCIRYSTSGNANSGKGFGDLFFLPFFLFGAWFYKINSSLRTRSCRNSPTQTAIRLINSAS